MLKNSRKNVCKTYVETLFEEKLQLFKKRKSPEILIFPGFVSYLPQHKRWIRNLIKKETCFAVIIDNKRVNPLIMNDKDSRGRYRDYTQRILIKK